MIRIVSTLPWLWLGFAATWAGVIFVTDQAAWPLALWIATTVGPLTALDAGRSEGRFGCNSAAPRGRSSTLRR